MKLMLGLNNLLKNAFDALQRRLDHKVSCFKFVMSQEGNSTAWLWTFYGSARYVFIITGTIVGLLIVL